MKYVMLMYQGTSLDEGAARVPAARLGGAIEIRPANTYW
jgi:hypothetical protein